MSAPVDVLAVMLRAEAGREWDMNKAAAGGDMSAASSAEEECRQMRAARTAVADAFDVLRMSAEALETATKYVGGDLAVVLNDRAMFARAALARVGGEK